MRSTAGFLWKTTLLLLLTGLCSCSSYQKFSRQERRQLAGQIEESAVFSRLFTGFAILDPETGEWLYQHEADKYYTPASNTKLFTLYTSLKVLADSLPTLRYARGDGYLVFQGTGNPLFLHPEFDLPNPAWDLLAGARAQLYFSDANYDDRRFGPGWSWADYRYGYQAEKSPLPLYSNLIWLERDTLANALSLEPPFFQSYLRHDPALDRLTLPYQERSEFSNSLRANAATWDTAYFQRQLPIYDVQGHTHLILGDTLHRWIHRGSPEPADSLAFTTLYQPLPDTLLRKFMQESDNYLAEQLLLMCSAKLFDGRLNTSDVIDWATDSLFQDLPDPLNWADGSGLSRYNLFTPRSIATLLTKLYREYPHDWLFSILPAGGLRGTISSWYAGPEGPFVFAKTGTLANKHCLSGYLLTASGKTLIFSFMHNNYLGSSNPVKEEMEQVLNWIRVHY